MPRRWLYPIWAEIDREALTRPEVTTPDKWWREFSEPVLRHPGKIAFAALIASGGLFQGEPDDFVEAEVITLDKWHQPFSEPVRVEKRLHAALNPSAWDDGELLTQPEFTSLDKWFSPFSEPTLVKKPLPVAAYPSSWDDPDALTREEVTSLDKWYAPLAEPASPDPRNEAALIASSGGLFQIDVSDLDPSAEELAWYKNLELHLSVYTKKRAPDFPAFTIDPELLTQPEVTTLDKWWQPASEPVRVKEPINVSFGEFRTELEIVAEEEITLDKWWRPLAEPVLVKPRASSFPEPEIDSDALTRPETTSLDKWYQPLSEFLHNRKRSAAALEPASVIDAEQLTLPEETLVSKWVPQTNEPVRVKKGLLAALQQAFFVDANIAAIPPAEDITLDKWYRPLEQPVLVKARASEFPTFTVDTEGLTQPEVTSLDKWFVALSEPVRVQPRSLAGLLAGEVYVGEPTDVEPLAEFMGWYKSLDEPVLPLVLPVAIYPATFFENEVSELDPSAERLAWYVDLSIPTLPKVRVAEFPAYTTDPESLTQPETAKLDHWWRELSEPVRTQPRSLAALISGEVQIGEPSDIDPVAEQLGWYRNLSLPTLPKPRVAEFPAFVIDAEALTLEETITLDKWWQRLSEPVLVKARFHESLQRHVVTDTEIILAEIITLDKWYMPLVEPIRLGDRLIVPFRLPASVGREYQTATRIIKGKISKEADQTHVSKEADQTHISKEADQTKDSKRC